MLDLLQTLYDFDPIRFTAWEVLAYLNLDTLAAWSIDKAGWTLWEDYSISK